MAIVTDLSMLKLQFLAYSVLEVHVCRKNVIFYHILNFFLGGGGVMGYLYYNKTFFLIMNY